MQAPGGGGGAFTRILVSSAALCSVSYFSYMKSKQVMPERVKAAWQSTIQQRVYPALFKIYDADVLHFYFLQACKLDLIPQSGTIDTKGIDMRVKTKRGVTFPSPVGVSSGFLTDGCGIDAILGATGRDSSSGLSTFIELGTCTPERQIVRAGLPAQTLKIDLESQRVARLNPQITPGVSQIVSNLLRRQQRIIDGKIEHINRDNMIGVNVKAQTDTVETVPYLTHLDYARSVRELTEFVDYVVLNLAEDVSTSGIIQFYKKGPSLNKLLQQTNEARLNELGRVAAHQFEAFLEKTGQQQQADFTTSVRRHYSRQSLLSALRPMLLLVQVDLTKMNDSSHKAFLTDLVKACKQNDFDGVVLRQGTFDESAKRALQMIREIDPARELVVVSEGRSVSTAAQVEARLQAGADLTTMCDQFFLSKGPYAAHDLKQELVESRAQAAQNLVKV